MKVTRQKYELEFETRVQKLIDQERDPWKAMVEPPIERFKKMYHKSQSEFKNRESKYYFYPINNNYEKTSFTIFCLFTYF